MTAQFRRYGDIIADIQYRFSVAGVRNRHTPERIQQLFNVSVQELIARVSRADDGTFLDATGVLALPTTAAITGEVYSEIPWPVNASRIYGVRVLPATGQKWYPLKKIPWAAIHDYQYEALVDSWRPQPGPVAYASRRIPRGVETVETAGTIMILPVPRGGSYRLWYMTNYEPQLEDDDLFNGHSGWLEWCVLDVMIKMLSPDADSKKMYDIWSQERNRQEMLIESEAIRLSDGMAMEPRDARGDGYDRDGYGGPL